MSSFEAPGFDVPESNDDRLAALVDELREVNERLREELAERPTREEFDELAERVDEVEQHVDEQPTVEVRGDDDSREIADVWVDGLPLGRAVENNGERSKQTAELVAGVSTNEELAEVVDEHPTVLDCLGDATAAGPAGLPDEVKEQMRPIHEMSEEVKNGRLERLSDQHSARRGARLFARIHRKAAGEVGDDDLARLVKRNPSQFYLEAPDAAQILDADGDPDRESGPASEQTKRAMDACARLSGTDELSQLVELDTDRHINRLVVDADEMFAAMESLENAREAWRDDGPDDPDRRDPDDVDDELDRLTDAEGPPT